MYVDVDEEELDDDFFQELDAAEAAATHSRAETRDPSSDASRSGDALIKKSNIVVPGVPRTPAQSGPAAAVPKSPPGHERCQARRTSEPGTRVPNAADRCSQDCTAPAAGSRPTGGIAPTYAEYHWEVKTISVRDDSQAAEEDVGKVSRIQGTSTSSAGTYSSRV